MTAPTKAKLAPVKIHNRAWVGAACLEARAVMFGASRISLVRLKACQPAWCLGSRIRRCAAPLQCRCEEARLMAFSGWSGSSRARDIHARQHSHAPRQPLSLRLDRRVHGKARTRWPLRSSRRESGRGIGKTEKPEKGGGQISQAATTPTASPDLIRGLLATRKAAAIALSA